MELLRLYFRKIFFLLSKKNKYLVSTLLIKYYLPLYNFGIEYYIVKFKMLLLKFAFKINFQALQDYRLRRLIKHAYNNVPYYRKLFDNNKIRVADIRGEVDLKKIPLLTKDIIKKNFKELISDKLRHNQAVLSKTSGTTGYPLLYYCDKKMKIIKTILLKDVIKKSGCKSEDWNLYVNTRLFLYDRSRLFEINKLFRKIYFSTLVEKESDIMVFLKILKKYKPTYIQCMPSQMYLAALSAEKNGICVRFKTFISDRENLQEFQLKKINKVFGCTIYDVYSMHEDGLWCLKEPGSDYFKTSAIYGLIEMTDGKRISKTKNLGILTTTNLVNRSMPLLRYVTDDVGSIKKGKQKELWADKVIKDFQGRESDIIKFKNQYIYPATLANLIIRFDNVKECQYLYSTNRIVINIVKSEGFSKDNERLINDDFRDFFNSDKDVIIKYVKKIQRTKEGKFQFVKKL